MSTNRNDYIKNLIEESDWTIPQIAEEMQRSKSTVYRWLEKDTISLANMSTIADIIGVDISKDFPQVNDLSGKDNMSTNKKLQIYMEKTIRLLEEKEELEKRIVELENALMLANQ